MSGAFVLSDGAVGVGAAALGLGLAAGSWMTYFWQISKQRVALRPIGHLAVQITALGLAVGAIAWSGQREVLGAAVIAPAAFAALNAGMFVWLYSQRKTPVGDLRVAVGDPLPAFHAVDSEGRAVASAEAFAGKRVLLKFFRGHW